MDREHVVERLHTSGQLGNLRGEIGSGGHSRDAHEVEVALGHPVHSYVGGMSDLGSVGKTLSVWDLSKKAGIFVGSSPRR